MNLFNCFLLLFWLNTNKVNTHYSLGVAELALKHLD